MSLFSTPPHTVHGVVQEVLPSFGLAYVADEDGRTWALTRAAVGEKLDKLREGQHLALSIIEREDFELATGFTPLE